MKNETNEKLALKGKTVLVTRARKQASALSDGLRLHGAEVVEAPAIRIEPPEDWQPLDEAVDSIERYDWILFTSANAVEPFIDRLKLAMVKAVLLMVKALSAESG